jgi:hypothetical protein
VGLDDEVRCPGRLRRDRDDPLNGEKLATHRVEYEIGERVFHHLGAGMARELHRQVAHPAGGSGDDDTLPGLQAAVHEQRLPRAQPAHRQRRRLDMAQARRLWREHLGGHRGVIGGDTIPIERRQREHFLARIDDGTG